MKDFTKHLSFLFPVDLQFLTEWTSPQLPEINVIYTLDWRGVVAVQGFTVTPGMCRWINDWVKLEEELQHAAENNSKQYSVPGEYKGNRMRPEGVDTYQDIHDQWRMETRGY